MIWTVVKVCLLVIFIGNLVGFFTGKLDALEIIYYQGAVILASSALLGFLMGMYVETPVSYCELCIWFMATAFMIGFGFYLFGFLIGIIIALCLVLGPPLSGLGSLILTDRLNSGNPGSRKAQALAWKNLTR